MCMHETSKPDLVISPLIEQTQSARFALIERIFEDFNFLQTDSDIFSSSALVSYWDMSLELHWDFLS